MMVIIDVLDWIVLCVVGGVYFVCFMDEGEFFTWGSNDDYACGYVGLKVYVF